MIPDDSIVFHITIHYYQLFKERYPYCNMPNHIPLPGSTGHPTEVRSFADLVLVTLATSLDQLWKSLVGSRGPGGE